MASALRSPYKVFISHAGEDKTTIAFPLREKLLQHAITAFVDEKDMPGGTWSEQAMTTAMETADIAVVVLSPEFVARKWPMRELLCFLRRNNKPLADGRRLPVIIPFFYRLSIKQLYDEPRLEHVNAHGTDIYRESRFFQRMENGEPEANIANIKNALRELHGAMGVENYVDASNDTTTTMLKRRIVLLDDMCEQVRNAVTRIYEEITLNAAEPLGDATELRPHYVQVEPPPPDISPRRASHPETTIARSLVSYLARGCMDLVVYSSKALIALGNGSLLRIQEELVASALADCSDCLRLLGNKAWYFCGSNTLPAFVIKMALRYHPYAARRKIVDMLMSLSPFGTPQFFLDFRTKSSWDATTAMDVSFVNALIIKDHFRGHGPRAQGRAEILNDINPVLNISASDMLLVLQTVRCKLLVNPGLVIVSKREKGLGWYQVLFERDIPEESGGALTIRLEYVCSLDTPQDRNSGSHDMRDSMILNFLHTAEIPPEATKLREHTSGKNAKYSYMKTSLSCEINMHEGYQATFDVINVDGNVYIELLEIVCLYTLRAGYHVRCQSYVDSLVENVDERQLVVSNAGRGRSLHLRRGMEISFDVLAGELLVSVLKDADERRLPASCEDLVEYGRFCTQREVRDSWYDLLVGTVANRMNVNFAQAALTGRSSYTNFVAKYMSVRLKDSILLCDPASDSVAVAFDGVSELSSSLKAGVSELVTTTASERLRAAFFICNGAVRANRHFSTRMVDVMRSRYMGLQGIGSISARHVAEDLDEGELRNPAVLVECMECLAMQGGYTECSLGTTLFNELCSRRQCAKTIVVTGFWPPLFGNFRILRDETLTMVKLQDRSKLAILASRHGDIYSTQQICKAPYPTYQFTVSDEFVSVK